MFPKVREGFINGSTTTLKIIAIHELVFMALNKIRPA
jgi:hypothetical protein